MSITDSKDHPLEGAMVHFFINPDDSKPNRVIIKEYITGPSGFIFGDMRFDQCIGRSRTPPYTISPDVKTKWQTIYNTGYWGLSVRGNDFDGIEPSTLTQICKTKPVQ